MDSYISCDDCKIISFSLKEYVNTYKKEPEGFEAINVIAQALGCFCFCLTASELLKNLEIKPSFKHAECDFIYELSDFEKKYLKTLSIVRKNKLLASKNYAVNFEKENVISGKAFICFNSSDENSLKLSIKIDFNKINVPSLEIMSVLFESIWLELFPQINKSQKPYNQKTLNYIPDYLKFATAPFVQELRRLMTSEKDNIFAGKEGIIAEKITSHGHYVFKNADCEQRLKGGLCSPGMPFMASNQAAECDKEINTQILNQISKMNDLTVDVLNGVIHILLEKSKTFDMEILLNIDDLLFIRGKRASKNQKGIRGGYKDSQRKEILEHLELLANIKINISNAYIPVIDVNGKRNYELYTGESPIFYMKRVENKDYCFYVKAGEVLAMSIRGAAAKTGLLHKKVAEYDYYRNFWEKRIGNYLAWIWRSRQNKADFLVPLTIETLLNQIGEENKIKRPQAIRDRLENALYKLENDTVIKSWQYKDIDETVLTGKNWFEIWLKLKLIIEPPVEIFEEYSKIKKIKNKSAKKFDFQEILAIIKEKNLSQITIAEETGLKQEVLSGILTGKISPNPSEKRKLQNWVMKQIKKEGGTMWQ